MTLSRRLALLGFGDLGPCIRPRRDRYPCCSSGNTRGVYLRLPQRQQIEAAAAIGYRWRDYLTQVVLFNIIFSRKSPLQAYTSAFLHTSRLPIVGKTCPLSSASTRL